MQQKLSRLLEELRLRQGLVEIGTSAAKQAAEEATKQALANIGKDALQKVAQETAKAAAGILAGPLLRLLFNAIDTASIKMDRLIRSPFETGLREAKRALELQSSNLEEAKFREDRLRFAMDELEPAWTLAEGTSSCERDRFLIRLIQGFCAREMSGGMEYAKKQLSECADQLEEENQQLHERVSNLATEISHWQSRGATIASLPTFTMRAADNQLYAMTSAWWRLRQLKKEYEPLTVKAAFLADFVKMLRALI